MLSGSVIRRLLIGLAALLLPATAFSATANPHIVLQSRDTAVEAVAWTPDDKYLVAASGVDHSLTIWDVANRRILDRATLPADPAAWGGDMLRIESVEVTPDGRSAIVRGITIDITDGEGTPRVRDYRVDLASRVVTVVTGRALSPGTKGIDSYMQYMNALKTIYDGAGSVTSAQAVALLPILPRSHDGRFTLARKRSSLDLTGAGQTVALTGSERRALFDGDLSPDGLVLAVLGEPVQKVAGDGRYTTPLIRFNVATGAFLPPVTLQGSYGFVRWLDGNRILLTSDADAEDRTSSDADAKASLAPALVMDAGTGAILRSVPGRCYITPIAGDDFFGADPANCRNGAGKGHKLLGAIAGQPWMELADFEEYAIDAITSSRDGKLIAITGALADGTNEVVVMNMDKDDPVDSLSFPKGGPAHVSGLKFIENDTALLVTANGGAQIWKFGTTVPSRIINARTGAPQMIATDGKIALISGIVDDVVARVSLADGKALPPLPFGRVIAGGFITGKPIFWAVSQNDGIRFWDTRNWQELMTSIPLGGDHFVTVMPDGRYDTDLGPDADAFRWIVPDAPFQSLPAQTFMRDYFTPRLAQKLIDCTVAGTCAQVLPPLPSLTSLNRVLPEVKIVRVVQDGPNMVRVDVEARERIDPAVVNGKTKSGLYNLRLYRNGRFVDHAPQNEELRPSLADWRELNSLEFRDHDGVWRYPFTAYLPSGSNVGPQVFTAYAFNEDRIKSDSAKFTYTPPPTPLQPKRAYIINVGIDDYREARLKLRFAGADAHLIGDRLAAIPGYETRRIDLTTKTLPDGRIRYVTKDVLSVALLYLSGGGQPKTTDEAAAFWHKKIFDGFDVSGLDRVTPDDLVIITWSGHGWANPRGDFFLLPSDVKWPAGSTPDEKNLISAADLTQWLRSVNADEIALIIDACHSGASVDAAGFKPGPMGDSGLGQLAYDKNMRILAATQASDVAIEDARVGQGLLTYALAAEGVSATGGRADLNKDGRITLDEWLRYAVQRLPSLSADVKLGRLATARGFDLGPQQLEVKAQEPALFDFTNKPSPVILRTGVK